MFEIHVQKLVHAVRYSVIPEKIAKIRFVLLHRTPGMVRYLSFCLEGKLIILISYSNFSLS